MLGMNATALHHTFGTLVDLGMHMGQVLGLSDGPPMPGPNGEPPPPPTEEQLEKRRKMLK